MAKSMIGIQLYTLREFLKTPLEIARTLKKVKSIGYDAVQLSGLGPIETPELKTILDGEGLEVAATHESYERMRQETRKIIDEHTLLGCRYTALSSIPESYRTAQGYFEFAKDASEVAHRLAEGGISFSYHNHSFELEKYGKRTGLEILYEESDPTVFNFEIDTYWIQHGGGSPVAWIRQCKGRIPLVHFKDMTILNRQPVMAEVGEGNLNWPEICRVCFQSGVKWFLVEQDICQRDPFESLVISLENMHRMGLE
ncbi:sugar phosphate isomerase/epimerase [candidate division KSB1 bacterium]|nr:sugar phosphate isomerase/epimerase [candidate division KSB1 bacterium]